MYRKKFMVDHTDTLREFESMRKFFMKLKDGRYDGKWICDWKEQLGLLFSQKSKEKGEDIFIDVFYKKGISISEVDIKRERAEQIYRDLSLEFSKRL